MNNYNNDINDSENASFVTMSTTNQLMPLEAHYSAHIALTQPMIHIDTYSNHFHSHNNMYTNGAHEPHITATPVVKSHTMYNPSGISQTTMFSPSNLNNMEIDDYFVPTTNCLDNTTMLTNVTTTASGAPAIQYVYSPSSTSVTTNNSSIMFIDNVMSPSSPMNLMSPLSQQNMPDYPMDSFAHPNYQHAMLSDHVMDNATLYAEVPIVPTDIGMYSHYNMVSTYNHEDVTYPYVERRRTLPRRHTVSTPYGNIKDASLTLETTTPDVPQQATTTATSITKSRKSSLKSKRHRSLGKLEMSSSPDLTEKLETWSHQQLLERIQQLEKEKQAVVQNSLNKQVTPDESGVGTTKSSTTTNKVRSASHTDTEVEEEEEEDLGPHLCQWDTCILEFDTLNDLILHVKTDHIGSGKANYYCCWKDCARKQKPFTKRHKMHNHLRTHTGERPFVCEEPDCGKRFSRLDSLTTHSKIHSNIRPYLCSFGDCGKAYYHLRSLRKHERSHKTSNTTPPPPLPIQQPPSLYGEENQVLTDWGLSAQAAVLNVMNREYL